MKNAEGSLTSLGAAALRAVHQLLDGEPRLFSDPVILRWLSPDQLDQIKSNAPYYREPVQLGLRSHIVLRSRYAEDRLALAYARGIRQYLLLGAGLDTFAWRQPRGLEGLRIFEADHPATQAQKQQRLAQAGIEVPDNCEFVPVNFETESLEAALRRSSLDFGAPVFISWLGVMVYLSMEATDAIFRFVVTLPASTELVFTFSQKRFLEQQHPTAARAAEVGEPWLTFLRPEELAWKLCKLGYASLDFLQPEKAEALYYTGRPSGLPVPLRSSIAIATV